MVRGSFCTMDLSLIHFFMYCLSQQLRTRAKTYFSLKFNREVSDEEVESYLINLAHLYDLFTNKR